MHNALFFFIFFFFFLEIQGFSVYLWSLSWNSLCRPRRPQTHRGPRPSPTQVLGLKALTTSAQWMHNCLNNWAYISSEWWIRTRSFTGHLRIYRRKVLHVSTKQKDILVRLFQEDFFFWKGNEIIKKVINTSSVTIWAHIITKTQWHVICKHGAKNV